MGNVICKRSGCDRPASPKRRGWCNGHYMRWYRYGDPTGYRALRGQPAEFVAQALASATNECILWPFGSSNGYATFGHRMVHVHVCEQAHGPRPVGMQAAHSCGDARCVNPAHLRWATPAENWADKRRHGTSTAGSSNPIALLTDEQVLAIRARWTEGEAQVALGREYGVSKHAIWRIVHRKNWTHLP